MSNTFVYTHNHSCNVHKNEPEKLPDRITLTWKYRQAAAEQCLAVACSSTLFLRRENAIDYLHCLCNDMVQVTLFFKNHPV